MTVLDVLHTSIKLFCGAQVHPLQAWSLCAFLWYRNQTWRPLGWNWRGSLQKKKKKRRKGGRRRREEYSETCLIFTLGGRAKCDFLVDSRQGSFQIQTWTVEPLSTWLKQGNTPQGVIGSVIKLLSYNIINRAEVQSKTSQVPAVMFNYFIWTYSSPRCLILNTQSA